MPKISTVVQEVKDETQPVRQKRPGSPLSESNSGTSGPTPNNNLEVSTNSKVLAKQASWTDTMEPSDLAAISDAGKVPSGEKGDSPASTSKRPIPARNAKGRWARKPRSRKTPTDRQDESKDDKSDANSQLIIALTNCPTANNNLEDSTNSKVLEKQASWTDTMEISDQAAISDAGKVPSGKKGDSTASTSKRPIPARNANGRWARKSRAKKTSADMQDQSKDANSQLIIGQDVVAGTASALTNGIFIEKQDSELAIQGSSQSSRQKAKGKEFSELPIQICSPRTREKRAQESNSQTDIDQKKIIKKEVQKSELPPMRCSSWNDTAPDSIFDQNLIIITEVRDFDLPIQWYSKSSRKITSTESIFDPNQIIETEVQDSELPIPFRSGSQSSGKLTATGSSSSTEFSPNKTVKKEGDSGAN